MLRPLVPVGVIMASACAQSPEAAPASTINFDTCLITHMAASAMLEDASSENDIALRAAVIASQSKLLADDTLDEDGLAQRTSSLTQAYGRASQKLAAEAHADGTAPEALAAKAIACGKELAE